MLCLRVRGFGNGAVPVTIEHPRPRLLFLDRGWKIFARPHNLSDGHVLRFKMTAGNLLSVKMYGSSRARLGWCEESSSGTDSLSLSGSDEERSDGSDNGDGLDPRRVKPVYEDLTSN
ncbi:l-ascorbate oxidase-like protein [Hordeum vulgare]|nr:l-ascorbate oxidase-like protein [Hordeum vulgare]KAE8779914.1 l-ascorbate oxidase-like protein [Hordeum vulgare]